MKDEYDWFLAEVDANGGIMNTDFATANYVTLDELRELEDRGIIIRRQDTEGEADLIFTANKYAKIATWINKKS